MQTHTVQNKAQQKHAQKKRQIWMIKTTCFASLHNYTDLLYLLLFFTEVVSLLIL